MPGLGRNDLCSCGSGPRSNAAADNGAAPRRSSSHGPTSRCSRETRRWTSPTCLMTRLRNCAEGLFELPAVDMSLLVVLPKLIGPELQYLLDAVADEDHDWDMDALIAVAAQVDASLQRAKLADALVRLRDQQRISRHQAAAAILDLDSRSKRFIDASLLEAIALSAGAIQTPAGLQLAA